MRGRFITLEGIDGVGKSTVVAAIMRRMDSVGQPAVATREPGGTATGEAIREILLDKKYEMDAITEYLLFAAARREHIGDVILPALMDGQWVICDRYVDSSRVYQGRTGDDRELIEEVHRRAIVLDPDLTVVLTLDVGVAAERIGADRMEAVGMLEMQRRQERYIELAQGEGRFRIVATDMKTPEEVFAEVWAHIEEIEG